MIGVARRATLRSSPTRTTRATIPKNIAARVRSVITASARALFPPSGSLLSGWFAAQLDVVFVLDALLRAPIEIILLLVVGFIHIHVFTVLVGIASHDAVLFQLVT